jgi:serine protease Do
MDDDKTRSEKVTQKTATLKNADKKPAVPVHDTGTVEPKRTKPLQAIFLILIAAVVGFGGGWLGAAGREDSTNSPAAQRVVLDKQSNLISNIAQEVGQSVVSVNVTSQSQSSGFGFFGQPRSTEQQSAGTGIIISGDGLVITNRHVAPEGTTKVSLVMSDGTQLDNVDVVGRTSNNDTLDVAFLRIKDAKGHKLVPAKLGKSSDMRVGDSVVAIGNALGQFQNTVTTGIISGYGRSVQASDESGSGAENLNDLFQTDAAINQGNSGGPLVNVNGEVIGINTAVAGNAENIGFAIPIDNISGLINSVSKSGKLERPYLGVIYVSLTDSIAKELNLSVNRGAYIPKSDDYGQDTVIDGGPADKAGVKEGDIITKVDSKDIDAQSSLASLLGQHQPGDKVKLTINRDGKSQTIEVTLGTMPNSTSG